MLLRESDITRFWSKVSKRGPQECWPWMAKARLTGGYGVLNIYVSETARRNIPASRISCFLAHGPAPAGKPIALHSCDNPPCCNPQHLRWGTPKDNVRDAIDRERHVNPPSTHDNPIWDAQRKAAMPKGASNPNAKMDETTVRKIWQMHLSGMNASDIAHSVGHSVAAVYDVCRGRSWRHLADAPPIDALKKGGVRRGEVNQFSEGGDTRALNPRTKIPTSEIPAILTRIAAGETYAAIGADYGVLKSAIWRIKRKA